MGCDRRDVSDSAHEILLLKLQYTTLMQFQRSAISSEDSSMLYTTYSVHNSFKEYNTAFSYCGAIANKFCENISHFSHCIVLECNRCEALYY